MLLRISAPHFVAGIELWSGYDKDDPVNKPAPILKYMKTWTVSRIMRYCRKKGWQYQEVKNV